MQTDEGESSSSDVRVEKVPCGGRRWAGVWRWVVKDGREYRAEFFKQNGFTKRCMLKRRTFRNRWRPLEGVILPLVGGIGADADRVDSDGCSVSDSVW